ncbi:MAG: hypothetical protein M3144_02765 [Actinomycetota bacterium]|nr:hypothetical protein [Actinomycetota bacterium]
MAIDEVPRSVKRLAKGLPALLAAALGVGLFFGGRDKGWWIPPVVIALALLDGWLFRLLGTRLVPQSASKAVLPIEAWIVGVVALAAGITLAFTLGGAAIEDAIKARGSKDDPYFEAMAGAAGGALEALAAVLFLKDFEDQTGSFWPSGVFKRQVQKAYTGQFTHDTPAHQAVFEERLDAPNADVKGWGFVARRRRARLIDSAPPQSRQTEAATSSRDV